MATVIAIRYAERQVGDLIVVQAPAMDIPAGWTDLTWNRDTAERVTAYRYHMAGDRDVRDVWGLDGDDVVYVAVFRGTQPISPLIPD